jgi:WD40 repeat protein
LLGVGGYGTAIIWDIATRKEIARLPNQHERLIFSSDNKTIASQGASRFRLWDAGAGKQLHKRIEYDGTLNSLAVSPDGARIATIGPRDSFIGIWDGTTGQPLPPIAISKSWPSRCSFSADGRMLIVSGSHDGLALLDVGTGKVVREFKNTDELTGNSALAVDAYLSKDKKRLTVLNRCWNEKAESSLPKVYHQLAVWDVETGKSILQRPFDPNEFAAAFSGDGMTVTGIANNRLKTEETLTGRERLDLPGNLCEPFALSPTGYLAAAGVRPAESKANPNTQPLERMRVVELATGEELFRLDCHPTHVGFSRDGRILVTASPACLQVWDAGTGAELFKLGWPEEPLTQSALPSTTSLIVRADGQAAITGMYDGTVLVWDLSAAKKPANWRRSKKLERNDLESLWADLAGDARTAQPCVHLLAAAPDQSIPFLADKVRPVGPVDAPYLDQLVAEFEGADFAGREIASRTITRLGEQIEPGLRRVLSGKPSSEARKLLETMLTTIHGPLTGETRRTARAIQVLTMIGTAESRQVLQRLAAGAPDARETRLAKTALGEELH